ncbi:MAG: hypothetical protein CMO01_16060 [Thalassobius sp.]|nr:hypothetical protein [Thalassovita sp.]
MSILLISVAYSAICGQELKLNYSICSKILHKANNNTNMKKIKLDYRKLIIIIAVGIIFFVNILNTFLVMFD